MPYKSALAYLQASKTPWEVNNSAFVLGMGMGVGMVWLPLELPLLAAYLNLHDCQVRRVLMM